MLVYHPAYDAYHCVFRALLISDVQRSIEISKLRILDFYLCFPAEVRHVRLPREHAAAKRQATSLINVYHGPVNSMQAFRDLEHIQAAAVKTLAASGIFDAEALSAGLVKRLETPLPKELQSQLEVSLASGGDMTKFILSVMSKMPLSGTDGLKHRTGLMEYRYDVS